MPLILIETNLKNEDIPSNFEVDLHKALAPVMGKDISVIYLKSYLNE